MTLETVYFVSQIVAAVAIVATLLFVGLQLRQSDRTQRALVHQSTIARTIELNQRLTDPHIIALVMKARDARAEWIGRGEMGGGGLRHGMVLEAGARQGYALGRAHRNPGSSSMARRRALVRAPWLCDSPAALR